MTTEKPILFSAPMVQAILAGRKTQTRRILKHDKTALFHPAVDSKGEIWDENFQVSHARFGKKGDYLWVRENARLNLEGHDGPELQYQADMSFRDLPEDWHSNDPTLHNWITRQSDNKHAWRPSIHLPRQASRINLEIKGLRIERLHDISREDCAAEGHPRRDDLDHLTPEHAEEVHLDAARDWFEDLWIDINGKDSWDSNPWVWVIDFEKSDYSGKWPELVGVPF